MINSLKALIVVGPMLFGAFWAARIAFAGVIEASTIDRWRNAFLAATLIGFMTPNFWAMLFLVAGATLAFTAREPRAPAMFLVLLCALPPEVEFVPGFAGVNYLILLSPQMMLAYVLLGPALLVSHRMRREKGDAASADYFFLLYALLLILLSFRDSTLTNGLRKGLTVFSTLVLPYYVLSRWTKSLDDVKVMTAAFVAPILALSAVAIAELALSWHFYAQATAHWKTASIFIYTERGGFVRAYASLMNPISLGYAAAVAMILSLPFFNAGVKKFWGFAGMAVLGAALFGSLSRGPWLGAALGIGVYFMIGPRGFSRAVQLALGGGIVFALLLPTPVGQTIFELLPFVGGGGASETITYRQELLETGWRVALRNPIFGSTSFTNTAEMQSMIQGQGIVDYVNSYLLVILESGFVGLALFLGVHLSALAATFRASRKALATQPLLAAFCRAFFAAHLAVLFMIATTSSVAPLNTINFIVPALGLAAARAALRKSATAEAPTPVDPVGDPVVEPAAERIDEVAAPAKPWRAPDGGRAIPKHLRQYVRE